ncbi:ankyrin repeat-containing domain protein [Tuber indicum]|nr:ankyrin repeat-containing domain protein [Tuber indicum]
MSFHTLPNEMLLEISFWQTLADQNSLLRTNRRTASLLPHVLIDTVFRMQDKNQGRKALYSFASRGDTASVSSLLARGILSFVGTGPSIITLAVETETETTLKTLLDCGVSAEGADDRGSTPIHCAARNGRAEMMRVLLSKEEYGIDVNMAWRGVPTPLICASRFGFAEVVHVLLGHPGIKVNALGPNRWSAMLCAIRYKRVDVLELLLGDPRVDVNTPTSNLMTPFVFAIFSGHKDIVQLLLKNPRIDTAPSLHGCPPLHAAAVHRDATILKMLLEDGRFNIHDIGSSQGTPLHEACLFSEEAVRLLLADGRIDVNTQNILGWTPLHVAIMEGNEATTCTLLQDLRVDIFTRNDKGETPLDIASHWNRWNILKAIQGEYLRRGHRLRSE